MRHARLYRSGLDIFIAVNSRDFFDQVFLDGNVKTVAGRRHRKFVALLLEHHAEPRQDLRDLIGLQRHAQHAKHTRGAQRYRLSRRQLALRFGHCSSLSATNIENQLCGAIQRSLQWPKNRRRARNGRKNRN